MHATLKGNTPSLRAWATLFGCMHFSRPAGIGDHIRGHWGIIYRHIRHFQKYLVVRVLKEYIYSQRYFCYRIASWTWSATDKKETFKDSFSFKLVTGRRRRSKSSAFISSYRIIKLNFSHPILLRAILEIWEDRDRERRIKSHGTLDCRDLWPYTLSHTHTNTVKHFELMYYNFIWNLGTFTAFLGYLLRTGVVGP